MWIDVIEWLKRIDQQVQQQYPPELPVADDPEMWRVAQKLEMSTRDRLSDLIRSLVRTEVFPPMTLLDAWFYRRRVEWAAQLAWWKAKDGVEPDATLQEVLLWILVTTWESDGCIGFWNACERGGQPHPNLPPDMPRL